MSENRLLDALTCRGVLASVSVRYWRARKQLRPSDLGLPDDKVNRRLISLGHKRLLPKERLAGLALIESRAHALLEANTFPFLNGIARYLPNERLAEVDAALADLQRQFESEQREFLRGYGAYRAEALEEWRETARGLVDDPSRLVAAIEDAFPPPELMDRHFGFHVSFFQLVVPDVPKAELVEAGMQKEGRGVCSCSPLTRCMWKAMCSSPSPAISGTSFVLPSAEILLSGQGILPQRRRGAEGRQDRRSGLAENPPPSSLRLRASAGEPHLVPARHASTASGTPVGRNGIPGAYRAAPRQHPPRRPAGCCLPPRQPVSPIVFRPPQSPAEA